MFKWEYESSAFGFGCGVSQSELLQIPKERVTNFSPKEPQAGWVASCPVESMLDQVCLVVFVTLRGLEQQGWWVLYPVWCADAGVFGEKLRLMGRSYMEKFFRVLLLVRDPALEHGKSMWSLCPQTGKSWGKDVCWGDSDLCSLMLLGGGGREIKSRVACRKKGGVWGRCFKM